MPPPPTTVKTTVKTPRQTVTVTTAKTPVSLRGLAVTVTVAVKREFTAILFWRQLTTNSNKLANRQE